MPHRIVTPEEVQKISQDYRDGFTLNQLAVKYRRGTRLIRRLLVDNGVRILAMGEGWRKHTLDETYFDKIDTREKAYVLGFIYADGCVYFNAKRPGQGAFMLNLQRRDIEMFRFIQGAIKSSHPLYDDKEAKAYRLIISNHRFCESLLKAGVTPRKSLTLEFPSESILPKRLRRAFILGYFDGDGSVSHNIEKRFWSMTLVGTWQFLSGILREIHEEERLPIEPQLPRQKLESPGKNVFYVSWGGTCHVDGIPKHIRKRSIWYLYRYLYRNAPFALKRKRDKMALIASYYKP